MGLLTKERMENARFRHPLRYAWISVSKMENPSRSSSVISK